MRIYKQSSRPVEFVQIFGERNSGTNYLSKLIQSNLRHSQNLLGLAKSASTPYGTKCFGYKHWFINSEKIADENLNRTLFVVIYRNPYTWIKAMMKRPYALGKSIEGRRVEELPNIKLLGHINGKDTQNEFHPLTGGRLTLFELRKLKIENFESLKSKADSVAYVNLEELLRNPYDIIGTLIKEFGSAFFNELQLELAPPKKLLHECESPVPFSHSDTVILNNNISWQTENSVGYEKNSYTYRLGDV